MVVKAIDAKDVILEVPTEAKTEIYQKFGVPTHVTLPTMYPNKYMKTAVYL